MATCHFGAARSSKELLGLTELPNFILTKPFQFDEDCNDSKSVICYHGHFIEEHLDYNVCRQDIPPGEHLALSPQAGAIHGMVHGTERRPPCCQVPPLHLPALSATPAAPVPLQWARPQRPPVFCDRKQCSDCGLVYAVHGMLSVARAPSVTSAHRPQSSVSNVANSSPCSPQ